MSRDGINNLGIRDTEVLAEWLLYHISQERRMQLMAELPVIYGRLYPEVSPSRIASQSDDVIRAERIANDPNAARRDANAVHSV